MSAETELYVFLLLLIGVPASITLKGRVRNPTAFAIVVTWFFCRGLYEATHERMPLQGMILSDWAVIIAMFTKVDLAGRAAAKTMGGQLIVILWHERTPWDKAILIMFPAVWLFYLPIVGLWMQFWVLWMLAAAQLLMAGWEALHIKTVRMVERYGAEDLGSIRPEELTACPKGRPV